MRYRSFLLFSLIFLSLYSCQDECNPNDLEDVIVGRWDVFNGNNYIGEVTFESDGALFDRDHVFFGGFVNGLSFQDKIYTIVDDRFIIITVFSDSGLSTFEQEIDAFFFDCEFMDADLDLNIPLSFQRVSF